MALTIESPEAERLARELAERTGESTTEAVTKALRAALARTSPPSLVPGPEPRRASEILHESALRIAQMPVLDPRSPDEIIGYDENGLPA
jgi:antitoxin VapB